MCCAGMAKMTVYGLKAETNNLKTGSIDPEHSNFIIISDCTNFMDVRYVHNPYKFSVGSQESQEILLYQVNLTCLHTFPIIDQYTYFQCTMIVSPAK